MGGVMRVHADVGYREPRHRREDRDAEGREPPSAAGGEPDAGRLSVF